MMASKQVMQYYLNNHWDYDLYFTRLYPWELVMLNQMQRFSATNILERKNSTYQRYLTNWIKQRKLFEYIDGQQTQQLSAMWLTLQTSMELPTSIDASFLIFHYIFTNKWAYDGNSGMFFFSLESSNFFVLLVSVSNFR